MAMEQSRIFSTSPAPPNKIATRPTQHPSGAETLPQNLSVKQNPFPALPHPEKQMFFTIYINIFLIKIYIYRITINDPTHLQSTSPSLPISISYPLSGYFPGFAYYFLFCTSLMFHLEILFIFGNLLIPFSLYNASVSTVSNNDFCWKLAKSQK